MATVQPLPKMAYHDDALHDLQLWAKQQVLWIELLSKQQVIFELQRIMEGHSYSWHCINEFLQAQFDEGRLEFSLVDGDVLFEWNNLCDQKRVWEKKGRLSVNNAEFNVDCLINLKILPVQAGLGMEELHLVTRNMDKPNVSTVDLWAGPKDPESLGRHAAVRWSPADDSSASDSEDSDYVDEEEEVDIDDEISGGDGSQSEDYSDSSDESDEVETEDEGGVNIVEIDDDEMSDLEL